MIEFFIEFSIKILLITVFFRFQLNTTKVKDIAKIYSYYISNTNTELFHTGLKIELNELRHKILNITITINREDEYNSNDDITIGKIKDLFAVEKENNYISIDLNLPSFVLQSLNNIELRLEMRKIDYSNTEFDVDALVNGFNN